MLMKVSDIVIYIMKIIWRDFKKNQTYNRQQIRRGVVV